MAFVARSRRAVTVLHEGSVLAEGSLDIGAERPARHRSLSGALSMLEVDAVDLYLRREPGAARRLASTPQRGKVTCVLGPQRRRQDQLLRAIVGLQPIRGGRDRLGRRATSTRLRAARPRARAASASCRRAARSSRCLTVRGEPARPASPPLPRGQRDIPDEIFELFPVLRDMLRRRGGDLSGGQQQQLAIARALVTRAAAADPRRADRGHPALDHQGYRRVIRGCAARGDMAIVLVEQYFDFARDLADDFAVMDRGEVVLAGATATLMDEPMCAVISPSEAPWPVRSSLPARCERADGAAAIGFASGRGGTTRLARPRTSASPAACCSRASSRASRRRRRASLNTAGGLAGGDRIAHRPRGSTPARRAVVTTQAAEKIYRALDAPRRDRASALRVGDGGCARMAAAGDHPVRRRPRSSARIEIDVDGGARAAGRRDRRCSAAPRAASASTAGCSHDRWRVRARRPAGLGRRAAPGRRHRRAVAAAGRLRRRAAPAPRCSMSAPDAADAARAARAICRRRRRARRRHLRRRRADRAPARPARGAAARAAWRGCWSALRAALRRLPAALPRVWQV